MSSRRLLHVVALFSVLLLPRYAFGSCDGMPPKAGPTMIEVGGLMRHFVVRLPANYDGRTAAPVVMAFHPFGMNAQYMQARAPIPRAWPEAIAVYPEGSGQGGSGGLAPSWQGRAGERDDRDLKFFDAMLAWLDVHACVDRTRVFVLGYSNGAGLTYLLACERADSIAGLAIASGRMSCTPSSAKPAIINHGTLDNTIGYAQATDAAQKWASINRCAAPPKAALGCVEAAGCNAAALTLCSYAGGHEYNPTFTAAAVDFFKRVGR